MKEKFKNWFLYSKWGTKLRKGIAVLNTFEGIIHLVVAGVGFWGLFATGVWDFRLVIAPLENLIFGVFSIFTGYILGQDFHHHH